MAESKKTAKKSPAKKAPSKAPAKKERTKRYFYFPKSRGASFGWSKIIGDQTVPITFRAVNNILTVDTSTEDGKTLLRILENHRGNEKNGGAKFAEVMTKRAEGGSKGAEIEKLMAMDFGSLFTLLGGGIENQRLSKGDLIAKVLELE